MVKKTYSKSVFRIFKNNLGRFFALTAIIFLGIAFITGLGGIAPALETNGNEYYKAANVADIVLKSKSPTGFSYDELTEITKELKNDDSVKDVMNLTSVDIEREEGYMRLGYVPLRDMSVSEISLADGRFPENENEVVAEASTLTLVDRKIGEAIEIAEIGKTVTICGIVQNPMLFSKESEPALTGSHGVDENLKTILYFDSEYAKFETTITDFDLPFPIRVAIEATDINIKLDGSEKYDIFSCEYEKFVAGKKDTFLSGALADKNIAVLTLEENKSYVMYKVNIERIKTISAIFPVFFVAVSALVVLTTMTRLAEKDRTSMGCMKTLGYGNFSIMFKYLLFALLCCIVGFFGGLVVGSLFITPSIYQEYNILFRILKITPTLYWKFGLIASGAITVAVLGVTSYIILKSLAETPANLLRPKAPKPGKKVFLEKIPFLWKRISFKYKSTLRNILRHVKHFLMTVISVTGSTALVFAGLALRDAAAFDAKTNAGVMGRASDSIILISFVIIFCAALLEMLIIYNLTNINIEERKREIATLKVLGYKDGEVTGYIFREVFIMSLIGTLLGLPTGCLLVYFIFKYIEFGAIANIQWYSWILAVALSVVFTLLVDLFLRRKIVRTDMNTSLKTIE